MGSKIKNSEKRKYPRIESTFKINYKEFHHPLKVYRTGSCINIGIAGCRMETFEKLKEDLILTLYINIPLPYTYQIISAKIFAKVVQTKTVGKSYHSSLYFVAIDRKGAIAMKQWIDKEIKSTQKRGIRRSRKRTEKTTAVA